MRGEDFHGDGAVETGVTGAIDLTHPTCTKRRLDLVGAELVIGRQSHKWARL